MPTTHTPKYPVVDPEPALDRALGNFNFTDIMHVGAFTGAGFTFGWFGGRSVATNEKILYSTDQQLLALVATAFQTRMN
jgi:hypothetical protein